MPVEIRLAKENPNDVTAEVVRWLVDDGSWVRAGADVVEVESTKAVMTVTSAEEGFLEQLVAVADVVEAGTPLALVHPTREELPGRPRQEPRPATPEPDVGGVRFSESGRQELLRCGLDPAVFAGRGLVTAQLVREVAAECAASTPRQDLRPVSPAKRIEIDRLTAGASALASALTIGTESAQLRTALQRRQPVQPSVLAVTIVGVARALRHHPELNARFAGDQVEYYPDVNVGVAVDFGHGLRVPVIRNADLMDADDLTFALLELMASYEERRLTTADVSGGTVTVSDLSGDGVLQFQPRINQDQALALGIGADSTLPGHPMTVTAVFDHRVSTGRTVAAFLGQVKAHLVEESRR